MSSIDRLDLSERVLTGWEEMARIGATPSENLRLVEAELVQLASLRHLDEARVDALVGRYSDLAKVLRSELN